MQDTCRSLAIAVDGADAPLILNPNLTSPVCFEGWLYINGARQPQVCQPDSALTVGTLESTVISASNPSINIALVRVSGYATLVGEATELISESTALTVTDGAVVAFTSSQDRVRGIIACLGEVSISSGSDTCIPPHQLSMWHRI